jgi:hypothetical protein
VGIGEGLTITIGQPEFDLNDRAPPKLTFLVKNPTSFRRRLTIDVEVSWTGDRCPAKRSEKWTGTLATGENNLKIFDADLDAYVGSGRCTVSGFNFTASYSGPPTWLDGCEDATVIGGLVQLNAGDSDSVVRKLFGEPSNEKTDAGITSLFYIWRPRSGAWGYDPCSFRVDAHAGVITSVTRLSEAEAKEVETKLEAAEEAAEEAQAARRQRLAAERKKKQAEDKKKQAEDDARYAKVKAAADAKTAEERAKVRAACAGIYQSTIDKKVRDLTVREEQQVRTCQALGLYPPQ